MPLANLPEISDKIFMQHPALFTKHLIAGLILYVAIALGLAALVYQQTLHAGLEVVRANGIVRLNEAASRLRLQVDAYRALVNVIANEPQIAQALVFGRFDHIQPVLQNFEATYGAWRVDVADPSGRVRASSRAGYIDSFVPGSIFRAAMNNRLGFEHSLQEGQRIIRLSRAVKGSGARPQGVVVVSVSLADLEFEWPVSPEPILFFNSEGLSFSSNRPYLLLLSRSEDPEEAELDLRSVAALGRTQLWQFRPPQGETSQVLLEEIYVPHLDLTAAILLSTEQARATAVLRAALVLAGALVIGLIAAIIAQQQRRLAVEARHSAELETRVEARTYELRKAQAELVEASKLAALGRLSAGISHELNQPLAAILNFAQNGQKFLERSKPTKAAENFALISGQINRITRIIGNLRTFARQEAAATDRIDFGQVTRSALALCEEDLSEVQVTLDLTANPVPVLAGRVRLEQVILNLITNALDAMKTSTVKHITITLTDQAELTIQDTGHGITDPSRLFEPFYTTKELGASKGLGMGLALSHGIIARFGGELSGRNTGTGAAFKISLPLEGESDVT